MFEPHILCGALNITVQAYDSAVELCLLKAAKSDPKQLALIAYTNDTLEGDRYVVDYEKFQATFRNKQSGDHVNYVELLKGDGRGSAAKNKGVRCDHSCLERIAGKGQRRYDAGSCLDCDFLRVTMRS